MIAPTWTNRDLVLDDRNRTEVVNRDKNYSSFVCEPRIQLDIVSIMWQ